MHAHDQLTREEIFQLDCLKDKVILGDKIQLFKVLVLLEFLKYYLLLYK